MIYLIILIGFLLRVTYLNKPEGLWNDEYVSWYVANTPFADGFWQAVLKQCHMPLYYLYLKPFSHCSDLVLRLTSVIPNIVAIWVMYLVGKEFSKKNGLFCAGITSILSFLIYYSQEVRFYSLLFLFSALSLLFTIKLIKKTSRFNIAGYMISTLLILSTHVLGGIYVFFNFLYVMYKKNAPKYLLLAPIVVLACLIPFANNILNMLPSSQWWGNFSYTNILFLFSDYFSPILTNNVNAPPMFFYNKSLAVWLTVPTLIALLGLVFGIKNKKGFGAVAIGTISTMALLTISGKLVFITKYSIEILPILILLVASGFERLRKFGIVLFTLFISLQLAPLFIPSIHYVTQTPRSEGHRIVGEILKSQNPDNIIFTYYEPDRFERYVNLEGKNLYYISKINRFEYRDNPSKILDNIKKGETVSVVILNSVSFFNDDIIKTNWNNSKIPEMFLTFSHIKNSLIKTLNHNYKDFQLYKIGEWIVIKGTKI